MVEREDDAAGTQVTVSQDKTSAAGAGAHLATRLRWLWPLLRTLLLIAAPVIVLLAMARVYYRREGYSNTLGFVDLGVFFARHAGLAHLAVSDIGFDGQFSYYLARDPTLTATCAHTAATCPLDAPVLRAQRILYPTLARVLALGHPALLPKALLAINLCAIVATALVIGVICRDAGASRWLGVGAALFCGEVLAWLRDLADPLSVLWLAVAVFLLYRRQYFGSALAVAAMLLTREQLVILLPFFVLPLVAERRWRSLGVFIVVACLPFGAWQVVLHAFYGQWPLLTSGSANPITHVPFGGLAQASSRQDFGLIVMCVAVPVAAAAGIALVRIGRAGFVGLLRDPVPLMVVVYCLLVSLVGLQSWLDMWSPARLAAPAMILGVIVASKVSPSVGASFATLLAVTALSPMVLTLL